MRQSCACDVAYQGVYRGSIGGKRKARRRPGGPSFFLLASRFRLPYTEGEGFEPSIRLATDNGFRDRWSLCPDLCVCGEIVVWEFLCAIVCAIEGRVEAA
jgi:hypothetical protein